MDLYYQAKALKRTMTHPDDIRSSLDDAKRYYRKQELEHLSMDFIGRQIKIEDEPHFVLSGYKHMESLLIATRNEEWMKNILPMIHEDSSLIAVGVGHLIGVNGLIAKLRDLGYRVEPMR